MSSSNYRYWVNPPEQDDNEWHFWCLEITGTGQEDIEDALLYVDLLEQTVSSTVSTGAITAWSDLRLGYSFDGSLQDFRIYNRALTDAERDGIFTNPMSRMTTIISGDKITTGTLQSTNWGASAGSQFNLNDGTFTLGGSSSPDLEFTGGVLSLTGVITISSGSDGVRYLDDAGDLAQLDEIDASYITDVVAYSGIPTLSELAYDAPNGEPAGLYLDGTHMGYHSGGAWVTYFDNTGKLFLGSSEVTSIPQTLSELNDDSTGGEPAGMYMDSSNLGFWSGTAWDVYIGSTGSTGLFYLGGTGGDLQWDGNDLKLGGSAQLLFGSTLVHGSNLMAPDIRLWHETTTPDADDDMGYFTDTNNPYGGDDNNAVVKKINPWGYQDFIWECTATTGDVLDGGWGYNTFTINPDLRHRYTSWVKQCGDHNGGFYFGCFTCSNLTANGSDSNNTNPYFRSNTDLPNVTNFVTNAVTNGTMEIDNYWTSYNSPTSNIRSSTQEHAGSYSRRIIVNGERQGIYSNVFTVEGFVTYRLSVWLYGDGNTWHVGVDDGTERFFINELGTDVLTPISGEWTKHVIHFQPKNRSQNARVYIVSAEDHNGTIYVDDVEVKTNGIINGDFEEVQSTQTSFTGWAHTGTPTYCERSTTTEHGGSYSWRISVNAANEGVQTSKHQVANGNATSTSTNNLRDTGGAFQDRGVAVGDKVYNNSDNTCTTVTVVTSQTSLALANNIFASGEAYIISSADSYIKLVGGYQYRCVLWLYGNASNTWKAKVSDGTNDYNFLETDNTTTIVPPASWTQYTLDFEASANTDSAYIEITSVGTSGTLYIDDVTLQDTPWYLLTAFLHPDNYAGTESWGGIYHYKSGLKTSHTITDFKSQSAPEVNGLRLFYYNSSIINPPNQQYQYSPTINIVDGSEPTVAAILGNARDAAWNIEGTTNISRYLVESPTIRGGDYANGNYVQIDESGIRGFGFNVETFTLDAATGDVSIIDGVITGGTIQTSSDTSSERVVIQNNSLKFYDGTGSYGGGFLPGQMSGAIGYDLISNYLTFYYDINERTSVNFGQSTTNNIRSWVTLGHENTSAGVDSFRLGWALSAHATIPVDDIVIDFTGTNAGFVLLPNNASNEWAKISVSTGGNFEITPTGNKLILYDDEGRDNNTQLWTSSSDGNFNLKPSGGQFLLHNVADEYAKFWIDGNLKLNIEPQGNSIILHNFSDTDSTEMWTDGSGYFNIKPSNDRVRIHDSAGAAGDIGLLYMNTSGILTIEGGDGNTVYINDNLNVSGTYNMDGSVLIDASKNATFVNINATGVYQMDGATLIDASKNAAFARVNATDVYQMDGSTIINTSKQQYGDFKTRSYFIMGLSGAISSDTYMRGPGSLNDSTYRAEYLVPYDCVVTSFGIATQSLMNVNGATTIEVRLQKNTGLTSTTWATVSSFNLTASDDGNFYRSVTGLSATLAAGDRIRVWLNFSIDVASSVTDPNVTIGVLSE